jgi:hypothetical protein
MSTKWGRGRRMKKMEVIYLDDTSDEDSLKEIPKEVICLVDSFNVRNDKENVIKSKHYKEE